MISVIVPVYNVAPYVKRCVQSILRQSFREFELLLIDDGSTDASGKLCDTLALKDTRIRVIHQENKGLSGARNTGIEAAQGEYITFIDSDDYIHKEMLAVLNQLILKSKSDIAVCDFLEVYEDMCPDKLIVSEKMTVLSGKKAAEKIVVKHEKYMVTAWGKLYKKRLFTENRFPLAKYHEDEFLTYQLMFQSKRVAILENKLYYYYQRPKSIMKDSYSIKRLDKLEALKEATCFFEKMGEDRLKSLSECKYLLNIQIAYYRVLYEMNQNARILSGLAAEYDGRYKKLQRSDKLFFRCFEQVQLKLFYYNKLAFCRLVKLYSHFNKHLAD